MIIIYLCTKGMFLRWGEVVFINITLVKRMA